MNDKELHIFVISDGTGETVHTIVRATLTQFDSQHAKVTRYKSVRSAEQVEAIIEEAAKREAVVVYTAVSSEVRASLIKNIAKFKVRTVDLLGPILEVFSEYMEAVPASRPGLLHEVNEAYYQRIEAMEFSVKQDDGNNLDNLRKADVILVGVSRTSKTPLSIYLSHKGWKVANVPLIRGIDPPSELFEVDQGKIFALTIDPESLAKIRRERLARMGRDPTGEYASLQHIRDEIEWARQLFSRNRRWPVFDVTGKALEETASEIERSMSARFGISKS
jgi:regulator of PEP synthase PpsR (kinase-PPPase family)